MPSCFCRAVYFLLLPFSSCSCVVSDRALPLSLAVMAYTRGRRQREARSVESPSPSQRARAALGQTGGQAVVPPVVQPIDQAVVTEPMAAEQTVAPVGGPSSVPVSVVPAVALAAQIMPVAPSGGAAVRPTESRRSSRSRRSHSDASHRSGSTRFTALIGDAITRAIGPVVDRVMGMETLMQDFRGDMRGVRVDVARLQKRPLEGDLEPIVEDTESSGPPPASPVRAARADGGIHIREPVLEEIVAERLRPVDQPARAPGGVRIREPVVEEIEVDRRPAPQTIRPTA